MRPVLIGTGFYATKKNHAERLKFLQQVWYPNNPPGKVVVVDNSESHLYEDDVYATVITIENNLGHSGDQSIHGNRIMGWSMSWIISALIAYSENCDFVYKEQDCLAFGNWLKEIRRGQISFGTNSGNVPCEQSLFYIERDSIPDYVSRYLSITEQDNNFVPEGKMVLAAHIKPVMEWHQFAMPYGRERPLTYHMDLPWYAQRITPEELEKMKALGLV